MATNKPPSRKTHITRVFGTNKKGERLDDIYADVERIDSAESAMQVPPRDQWQAMKRKFRWCDDPDDTEEYDPKGNPSRKTEVLKVCDPENTEDVNDPEEWIPLRVIKQVKTTSGSGINQKNQIDQFLNKVINEELRTGRKVEVRRVVHYDTNIDDLAQKAADADPTRKEYVVSSDFYTKNMESKDKDQYVEYEIVTKVSHSGNSPPLVNGQQRVTKLLNDYLIDESEDATLKIRGEGDINPPYRLDPFQNIVNIKFLSIQSVVVGVRAAPEEDSYRTVASDDGATWDTGFGADTSNAASGLGHTVVASERTYVAFGRPKNGSACFIVVDGHEIRRGVLNSAGDLVWSSAGTISFEEVGGGQATSCSFSGGLFFISYVVGDFQHSYLAVSSDGLSFTTANPWPGVAAESSVDSDKNPAPLGSCVVYDKVNEIYVTVGSFSRFYLGQIEVSGDDPFQSNYSDSNFMSSVSRDGIKWTPRFDKSQASGADHSINGASDIGSEQSTERAGSRVAFGNDIFVASSSYKSQEEIRVGTGPGSTRTVLTAYSCGVATSTDGKSWVNHRLPGSIVSLTSGGDCYSVKFIKAKRPGSTAKGFFVLGGGEFSGSSSRTGKLWTSEDGTNWALVKTFSDEFPVIISAINKSRGTVVNI